MFQKGLFVLIISSLANDLSFKNGYPMNKQFHSEASY